MSPWINVYVKLWSVVKYLYTKSQAKIKIGKRITQGFTVMKKVEQGCCLSTTLLKIYLKWTFNDWEKKCGNMWLPLNDIILFTLWFEDNQISTSQAYKDINYMTQTYRKICELGLEINLNNTKYLWTGRH